MKLEDVVQNIIDSKNIFELIDGIKLFINSRFNLKQQNQAKKKILLEYDNFHNEYITNYNDFKNIIIFPQDRPSLIIGIYVNMFSMATLEDILALILSKYRSEFHKKKNKHITLEEQLDIIQIAQDKYKYLDIVNISGKQYNILNFDYISKISNCDSYVYEVNGKNNYLFEIYDINDNPDILNKYYTFAYGLGVFLCRIFMKDIMEAPYGFYRFLKKHNMSSQNKEDLFSAFADLFAISVLSGTKYENSNLQIPFAAAKEYIENQLEIYKQSMSIAPKDVSEEIDDFEICPCGSKKQYKNCCKKKRFKWVRTSDKIQKQVPLEENVNNNLLELLNEKETSLNRYIYNFERILSDVTIFDIQLVNHIKDLRKFNISEELLYAAYKTRRLLNTKNIDFVSDLELEEWQNAVEEYRNYVKKDSKKSLSVVTSVLLANDVISAFFQKNYKVCERLINSFISEVGERYVDFSDFSVKNIEDFLIFCARKASINLNSFVNAVNSNDNDNAMSILRNLYEILININVYTKNKKLFEEKIMPLANIDLGICKFSENKDGTISRNKVVNLRTGEIYNTKITMMELSEKSNELYFNLYKTLFNESSFYIHLNVSSVDSFFKEKNPFFEVDSTNIASLLGIFMVNQIIYELSKLDTISDLLYRDMTYISDKIKKELMPIFQLLLNIEESNEIYSTIIKIISDYSDVK